SMHWALPVALLAVRVAAIVVTPSPPAAIAPSPLRGDGVLPFVEVARLQRITGESRLALTRAVPPPAAHAFVATHAYPEGALFALLGDKSLEVWYRDTTLHWVALPTALEGNEPRVRAILEFRPDSTPQVRAAPLRRGEGGR